MFRLALWTLRICGLIPTLNLSAFPLYYSAHFHTHSFVAKLIRDERELVASPCSLVALIALLTTTEVWSCTILLTSASLHFQAIYRRIQIYSSLIWFDAKQMGTPPPTPPPSCRCLWYFPLALPWWQHVNGTVTSNHALWCEGDTVVPRSILTTSSVCCM